MKVRFLLGRLTDMHSKTFRADIELSGPNIELLGRFLTFRTDIVTAWTFFLKLWADIEKSLSRRVFASLLILVNNIKYYITFVVC